MMLRLWPDGPRVLAITHERIKLLPGMSDESDESDESSQLVKL